MSIVAAEIDRAEREIVVEHAMRAARAVDDEERHHLVERIGQFGVETAGIDGIDREASAGAIERAGLVAEAVMALVFVARPSTCSSASVLRDSK